MTSAGARGLERRPTASDRSLEMTLRALCLSTAVLLASRPAAAQDRAADLPAPAEVSQRAARELANLELQELALAREQDQTDLDQTIAVTLYVGGVLGAIAAVSLTIGTIFEAVCIDGDVSACMDGPSFVAAAIPTAIITTTLLFGATLYQRRVDSRSQDLGERRREIDERRQRLEHDLGLAAAPSALEVRMAWAPTSITLQGRF